MRCSGRFLRGAAGPCLLLASLAGAAAAAAQGEPWRAVDARADPGRGLPARDPGELWGFDFTPDDCGETRRAHQALGGLLGGLTGGLIGSGIGEDSGKTVATIGGALLGTFGGALLGTRVAEAGAACLPEPGADLSGNLFAPGR